VVVDYWEVYDAMGVFRSNFLVNAACEFDSIRNESGSEVGIPGFSIFSILQIDPSNPVVRKPRTQLIQIVQEHCASLLVVVNEKYPLILGQECVSRGGKIIDFPWILCSKINYFESDFRPTSSLEAAGTRSPFF